MKIDERFEITMKELMELIGIADKRTLDVVDTFEGIIKTAVEMYPSGDLYDFLAEQTVVFAGCVVEGKIIRIDDLGKFFGECGFDDEKVEDMLLRYEILKEASKQIQGNEQLMLWGAEK